MNLSNNFLKLLFIFLLLPLFISAQVNKNPDYSKTKRSDIPVEVTWNTADIYPSIEDWKKDKEGVVKLITQIEQKRIGWTKTPQKMLDLYQLIQKISRTGSKLGSYAANLKDMDMGNPVYQTMQGELQPIFVDLGSKLSFMEADILKVNKGTFDKYFKEEPGLLEYKFQIEKILRTKEHVLPEEQEKIVSLTGLFSSTSSEASGLMNNVDIPSPEVTLSTGEKVTLNATTYQLRRSEKDPGDRVLISKTYWENRKKYENTFASLLNGAIQSHLFNTKVYKYPDCLTANLDGNNIDTNVYMQLIKTVKENLAPLHRLTMIKKELLGLDKFKYEDYFASAVKKIDRSYSWDEAKSLVLNSLKPLGSDYQTTLNTAFNNRWIDIYPNMGKQYGAYSRSVYGIHPFVKMNFTGKYDDVSTVAHELGHSVHSFLSEKNQTYSNAQYPIFLAEIASTFNENLMIDYMLKNEQDDMFKLYLLDSFLDRVRSTIYRQTLFAEFELAMHRRVENGNSLTAEWLDKTYLDLSREYYGQSKGVVELNDYYKNEWSGVPHFFRTFYVYQYSTGMIASLALSQFVLTGGEKERESYLNFLKSGGSNYPLEILKKAGVDMTNPKPYTAAITRFSQMIDEMEKLVKKLKSEGKI